MFLDYDLGIKAVPTQLFLKICLKTMNVQWADLSLECLRPGLRPSPFGACWDFLNPSGLELSYCLICLDSALCCWGWGSSNPVSALAGAAFEALTKRVLEGGCPMWGQNGAGLSPLNLLSWEHTFTMTAPVGSVSCSTHIPKPAPGLPLREENQQGSAYTSKALVSASWVPTLGAPELSVAVCPASSPAHARP